MSHGPADATGAVGPDELPEDLTLTMPRVTPEEPQAVPSGPAELPVAEGDWADDDLTAVAGARGGQFASGLAAGLAAVPYLRAAIRRRWRLWIATALVGLVLGYGVYTLRPPVVHAETQLLITPNPNVNAQDAVLTDVAFLQNPSLADQVLHRLRLAESVNKFMASYVVVSLTDRVLEIVVSAHTSGEAVQRADVIAATFLNYRASILQAQRRATIAKLNSELNNVRQQVATLTNQIDLVKPQRSSQLRTDKLIRLNSELTTANASLTTMEQAVSSYEVSSEVTNAQEDAGSRELFPAAALPPSKYRKPAVYAVGGLVAGLLLGMTYAGVGALMTDRLRRRDDVALAVGAPVRLSVGPLRLGRRGRRGPSLARALEAAGRIEVQRIAAQIQAAVPERAAVQAGGPEQPGRPAQAGGASALAVIAIDDPYAAVLPALALALSCARAGGQVIVADLTAGAVIGRLLGLTDPGVRIVTVEGEQLALAVPDPTDLIPLGPLPQPEDPVAAQVTGPAVMVGRSRASGRRRSGRGPVGQVSAVQSTAGYQLAAAYESADLLLTVATLDPALGAEHLPTWAADAVVTVTAGQSSATKIHSVSEMTWLAGTDIRGAILIGADKSDESIGAGPAPEDTEPGAVPEDIAPANADAALDASRSDDWRG